MRKFLLNTSYCNKDQNRQSPASETMYICRFYPSKFGLHPEMLPSLACIIKLLKTTIKTKTDLLMYVYFLLLFYILTNWYFNTHLTSCLNLANLTFLFIMPVTTICSFWILERRLLARAFFKVDTLEELYYICIFS